MHGSPKIKWAVILPAIVTALNDDMITNQHMKYRYKIMTLGYISNDKQVVG